MRPLFVYCSSGMVPPTALAFAQKIAQLMNFEVKLLSQQEHPECNLEVIRFLYPSEIADLIEHNDAAMVLYQIDSNKQIQSFLDQSREFRIPYLFVRPNQNIDFSEVAVPVTLFEEDREKAPYASAFGRFAHSKLTIFTPKDYGTKAKQNIEILKRLFDSFQLPYDEVLARKDSFGVEKEVATSDVQSRYGMIVISASRDYGLDDLLFGSKEKKILKKTSTPILIINPRGDLYALCD